MVRATHAPFPDLHNYHVRSLPRDYQPYPPSAASQFLHRTHTRPPLQVVLEGSFRYCVPGLPPPPDKRVPIVHSIDGILEPSDPDASGRATLTGTNPLPRITHPLMSLTVPNVTGHNPGSLEQRYHDNEQRPESLVRTYVYYVCILRMYVSLIFFSCIFFFLIFKVK